jgi:hypothetical protein
MRIALKSTIVLKNARASSVMLDLASLHPEIRRQVARVLGA